MRNHRQNKGTLMLENGEMAAVCLDCFETLKTQFSEVSWGKLEEIELQEKNLIGGEGGEDCINTR